MPTSPEELTQVTARHQFFVERYKSAEVKKFEKFLLEMAGVVRVKIGDDELSEFSRTRLNKLNAEIDKALVAIYQGYEPVWRDSLIEFGKYESEFEIKSLKQVVDYDFALPSASQIEQAVFGNPMAVQGTYNGFFLGDMVADLSGKTIKRVNGAINAGSARGLTTPEIVRSIIGTKKAGYADGLLSMSYKDANLLVRTGLQHTASMARQRTWEQNSDIITGWRFRAVFDSRTTQECRALDQMDKVYEIGKGPIPPRHLACRSSQVASLDSSFDFLSEGATRSASDDDGVTSVDADLGYYNWMKQQPAAFQDAALGKSWGKLLRDGGLSADRYAEVSIGKLGEPLTLAQARELDPVAFSKAGL
jgi:hypothetical protein